MAADIGAGSGALEVRAALRKLLRALPEPMRVEAEAAQGAVVVDPAVWGRRSAPARPTPHLDVLQQAVVSGVQVSLDYIAADRTPSSRVVHPVGLVAKGQVWYLVASTSEGLRSFRVDRVASASPNGEPVVRPEGFNLRSTWEVIVGEVEERRSAFRARGLLDPTFVGLFRALLGTRVSIGPPAADGRVEVEVGGHGTDSLAGELAGFGAALEVIEPAEVRERLALIGTELIERYGVP
ncbi:MAG: helix-turn-helix transcriptional regulator [Acidimicrobiales bacterium]